MEVNLNAEKLVMEIGQLDQVVRLNNILVSNKLLEEKAKD